jgi:hypothetical protein
MMVEIFTFLRGGVGLSSEGLALSFFLGSYGLCVFWPFFGLPILSTL